MANSKLQGNTYQIPQEILDQMRNNIGRYTGNKDTEGYNRCSNTIKANGLITYELLKRFKNFFDYADQRSSEFILHGGSQMLNWINNILKSLRAASRSAREAEKNTKVNNTKINKKTSLSSVRTYMPRVDKLNSKSIATGKISYESFNPNNRSKKLLIINQEQLDYILENEMKNQNKKG
jgi:hypothetical protein